MIVRAFSALIGVLVFGCVVAAAAVPDSPASVTTAMYQLVFHGNDEMRALRPLMTPRFYGDLTDAYAYEKAQKTLILDANPFIDAQIEAVGYTVRTPHITGATARVPVKIAYKRYPPGHVLTIVLNRTATGWRIDDILDHTGASTDALIRSNLARARAYFAKHPRKG
jgi:hypothetical protein